MLSIKIKYCLLANFIDIINSMLFLLLNESKTIIRSIKESGKVEKFNLLGYRNFISYYVLQSQLFFCSRKLFSGSVVRSVGGSNPVLPLHFYRYHVCTFTVWAQFLNLVGYICFFLQVYGNGQNKGITKTCHLRNYLKKTFLLNMIFHFMYTYV